MLGRGSLFDPLQKWLEYTNFSISIGGSPRCVAENEIAYNRDAARDKMTFRTLSSRALVFDFSTNEVETIGRATRVGLRQHATAFYSRAVVGRRRGHGGNCYHSNLESGAISPGISQCWDDSRDVYVGRDGFRRVDRLSASFPSSKPILGKHSPLVGYSCHRAGDLLFESCLHVDSLICGLGSSGSRHLAIKCHPFGIGRSCQRLAVSY
jgi:hypothetical protein